MKGNGLHKSPGPCPRHFILLQSLFCLLSTFSPNSPLPHNHLTGTTGDALSTVPQHQLSGGQMSSPQGFRDEARVAKPWPRWPIPRLRPGPAPLQPTGARSRRPQPGLPHAGSLGPHRTARTPRHANPGRRTPRAAAGERTGPRTPPDSRLYSAISLFNAVPAIPRNLRSAASPHPRRSRPPATAPTAASGSPPPVRSASGARAGDVARRRV